MNSSWGSAYWAKRAELQPPLYTLRAESMVARKHRKCVAFLEFSDAYRAARSTDGIVIAK